MGLLNWFFRRKAVESKSPPVERTQRLVAPDARPSSGPPSQDASGNTGVQPVWDGGLMVAIKQNDNFVVMDRDNFDYLYGSAKGPDPAQHDLDNLMASVSRVCVLDGMMFQGRAGGGKVLVDTDDRDAIGKLASCLRIDDDPQTFGHCACLGRPTLELYSGAELVATIGLHHGRSIRWTQWHHDAQLIDGKRLSRWLLDNGVTQACLAEMFERVNYIEAEEPSSQAQAEAAKLCEQARASAKEGKLDLALDFCDQSLALDAGQAATHGLRARVLWFANRPVEAAEGCSAAIDRGLRDADMYFFRALAFEHSRPLEISHADCSMAVHLDPKHQRAHNLRGQVRSQMGRLEDALQDFSSAISLAPEWFTPLFYRGQLYHSWGKIESALADYDRAIELGTAVPSQDSSAESDLMLALMHCRRGDARFDLFREEGAETDFDAAIAKSPVAAAGYLGDMWWRRGKLEQAKWEFERLISLSPDDARAYLALGSVRQSLGDLEEAESDFSKAIELQPVDGGGRVLRAQVRAAQGNYEEALDDLQEYLRRQSDDALAYRFRSAIHRKLGSPASAFADLNKAHRLAPENPIIGNSLAWTLATCPDPSMRDGVRALELARQVCAATNWQDPQYLDTLAATHAELGSFDEAVRWQRLAVEKSPDEFKEPREQRLELYLAGEPYRED